jgi:hypothetical protein
MPLTVCFFAPNAYPVLDPSVAAPFGGIETRSVLFARGLARRPDYEVSFLVNDHGQPDVQRIDGITVYADPVDRQFERRRQALRDACRLHANGVRECLPRTDRFPGFRVARVRPRLAWDLVAVMGYMLRCRFFSPRPPRAWSLERPSPLAVFREMRADVCLGFGTSWVTAAMVHSCRHYGSRSVLFLAADTNVSADYVPGSRQCDAEGELADHCHYALTRADCLLVQTARQQRLLKERFGRDSRLIRNPIVLDDDGRTDDPDPPRRDYALWIGRSDTHHKRPALCLELARRCPEIRFLMILNRRYPEVFEDIVSRRPSNVEIVERVPHREMGRYFRGARAFVSTSSAGAEGFPNTFLQAGKYGVPVVSLEADPDGLCSMHQCGLAAGGDLDRQTEDLRRVWRDATVAGGLARRMTAYLWEHHEAEGRIDELAAALRAACEEVA